MEKARQAKLPKSPVIEALQKADAEFGVIRHGKAVYSADEIAKARKRPASTIVKCILLTDGVSHVVACISGDRRVDAPKVREMLGTGKLEFSDEKDIKKMTGMPPGTTSPIGMKEELPVVIDKKLADRARVSISSGDPKFGIELKSADLAKLSRAKVANISK